MTGIRVRQGPEDEFPVIETLEGERIEQVVSVQYEHAGDGSPWGKMTLELAVGPYFPHEVDLVVDVTIKGDDDA